MSSVAVFLLPVLFPSIAIAIASAAAPAAAAAVAVIDVALLSMSTSHARCLVRLLLQPAVRQRPQPLR